MVRKGYGSKPAKFPNGSLRCGLKKPSRVARTHAHVRWTFGRLGGPGRKRVRPGAHAGNRCMCAYVRTPPLGSCTA